MMKWLLVAAVVMAVYQPTGAHDTERLHYHVGERQPFQGLICKEREPAMHIFNTWLEVDMDAAQAVFVKYQAANKCRFLNAHYAYFYEKIISAIAFNRKGKEQNIIVFRVSPTKDHPSIDYLVTWENVPQHKLMPPGPRPGVPTKLR